MRKDLKDIIYTYKGAWIESGFGGFIKNSTCYPT